MLASALVPSAIQRCPLFGVSAIGRFLKYSIYGKRSWYIAHCPLYGRCPLFECPLKNSFDLTQVVSSPTHVSHNGKETLIDLALISSSSKLKECSVIPPLSNSDHDGIHLALRMLSIAEW